MRPQDAKVTYHGGGSKRRILSYAAIILFIASNNCSGAEEGDWCINNDGEEGMCKPVHQCPGFLAKLSIYHVFGPNTPGLCFYSDTIGAVACCPLEERTTTIDYMEYFSRREYTTLPPSDYGDYDTRIVDSAETETASLRISEQKCQEYEAEVGVKDRCNIPPRPAALIVGGQKASEGEYPHMAALGYLNKAMTVRWNCGGTLISHQYILTAAHCKKSAWGQMIVARLGKLLVQEVKWSTLIMSTYARFGSSGDHPIDRVFTHPDYNSNFVYNDIALVRLMEPVQRFDELVRPACLYTQPEAIGFGRAEATGWGYTEQGGDDLEERPLMQVDLDLYSNGDCSREYEAETRTIRLHKGIEDTMMCAGDLNGGKDTCYGDSGGPLQLRSYDLGCLHRVLGVTSVGKACGLPNVPSFALYTRVSSYLPWIESIVWPEGSNEGSPPRQ